MHKAKGMVRDVFRTRNMRALPGTSGLGQVRYPTAGNADSEEEAQPFYVNAPFGIVLVHNGNLTNAQALRRAAGRSTTATSTPRATPRCCSTCWRTSCSRPRAAAAARPSRFPPCGGAQAHQGLVCRDRADRRLRPAGLPRPLRHPSAVLGRGADGGVMVASESVALEGTGHQLERDVAPGEALFITLDGRVHARSAPTAQLSPACSSSSTWRVPTR
jgi:amidophosphoribosyltransferase